MLVVDILLFVSLPKQDGTTAQKRSLLRAIEPECITHRSNSSKERGRVDQKNKSRISARLLPIYIIHSPLIDNERLSRMGAHLSLRPAQGPIGSAGPYWQWEEQNRVRHRYQKALFSLSIQC